MVWLVVFTEYQLHFCFLNLTSNLKNKKKTKKFKFDIKFKKQKPDRVEQFNLRDKEGQEKFKNILNSENNLARCFDNADDLETQCESWLNELSRIELKIRSTETSELLDKRSELISKLKLNPDDKELEEELEVVVRQVTEAVSKENLEKIKRKFRTPRSV